MLKNLSLLHRQQAFQARDNDLVPYWIFPGEGGERIQRHVPSLPLTRDRQLLVALLRSLAVYRLVLDSRVRMIWVYLVSTADLQDEIHPGVVILEFTGCVVLEL